MTHKKIDLSNFGVVGKCGFEVYKKDNSEDIEIKITSDIIPKTKDEIISFLMINDELNNFVKKNFALIVSNTESLAREIGGVSHQDIQPILKRVIGEYFTKHLVDNEVEVLCNIEREKSPHYPSLYRVIEKKIR